MRASAPSLLRPPIRAFARLWRKPVANMHPSIVDTSIIDLLEADPRPSFIVALAPHPPTIVYTNPAFAGCPALLEHITAKGDDSVALWEWITGLSSSSDPQGPAEGGQIRCRSFSYSNVYWTRSVVHEQMVVVGANEQSPSSEPPRKVRLDVADPRTSSVSPPRRIIAIENDMASVVSEHSSLSPPSSISDRPIKSVPATLPINSRERPPSRAEAVQSLESLARSVSDPGWILPDTKPGRRLPSFTFLAGALGRLLRHTVDMLTAQQ